MANDLTSSINNRVGGQQTASRADMVNRTARNYAQNAQSATITTTSGKQYTVDRDQMDWIKSRYMADQAGTYGYDVADQQAKANGQMSAKWRSTYGNSNVDRQLAEMGLPSEKNIEKYMAQYAQWHTGTVDQVFQGVDDAVWSKMSEFYTKDYQYENTAEDQMRKASNLMPKAFAEKYTDTELDESLMMRNLPPVAEFDKYLERYNNFNGIDTLYKNATALWTDLRCTTDDNGNYLKNDDNVYVINGEKVKGTEIFAKSFFDELLREDEKGARVYANITDLFKNGTADVTQKENEPYDVMRGREVVASGKADALAEDFANYSAFSYADFQSKYGDYFSKYLADVEVLGKDGNKLKYRDGTPVTYASLMANADVAQTEKDERDFYTVNKDKRKDINDNGGVDAFLDRWNLKNPTASPVEMWKQMYEHGIDEKYIKESYNQLRNETKFGSKERKELKAQWNEYKESLPKKEVGGIVGRIQQANRAAIAAEFDTPEKLATNMSVFIDSRYDGAMTAESVDAAINYYVDLGVDSEVINGAIQSMKNTYVANMDNMDEVDPKVLDALNKTIEANNELTQKQLDESYDSYVKAALENSCDQSVIDGSWDRIDSAVRQVIGDDYGQSIDPETLFSIIKATADLPWSNEVAVREALADHGFTVSGDFNDPMYANEWTKDWDGLDRERFRSMMSDAGFRLIDDVDREKPEDSLLDDIRLAFTSGVNPVTTLAFYALRGSKWDTSKSLGENVRDFFLPSKEEESYVLSMGKPISAKEYEIALDWMDEMVADGKLTKFEAYNYLCSRGLQDAIEKYDKADWYESIYKERTAPELWENSSRTNQLYWNGLSDEERQAIVDDMWNDIPDEDKAKAIEDYDWRYDNNIHRTTAQTWAEQITSIVPTVSVGITSGAVGAADWAATLVSGKDDLWGVTKEMNSAAASVSAYGDVEDNVNGALAARLTTDAAAEMLKMYTLGAVGSGVAGLAGEASSKFGDFALSMLKTSPFSVAALGNNFAQAKAEGATNAEAVPYAFILGTLEGVIESINVDKVWGRVFGQGKFGKMLLDGGRSFANTRSVLTKAWLASLPIAALSEASEEGLSYVAEGIWKTVAAWNGSEWASQFEWSAEDAAEAMLMGGLTGLLGAGLAKGSITTESVMYDYWVNNKKLSGDIVDVELAKQYWSFFTDAEKEKFIKGGAKVHSQEDFANMMVQLDNCFRGIEATELTYALTEANENAKVDAVQNEVTKLEAKLKSLNPLDPEDMAEFKKVTLELLEKKGDPNDPNKPSQLRDAKAKRDAALRDAAQTRDTNLANLRSQTANIQNQFNEHYAGIYLRNESAIRSKDYNAISKNMAVARQNGDNVTPESVRDSSSQTVDANQATGYNNNAVQEVATNGRGNEAAPGGYAGVSEQAVAGSNQGVQRSGADGRRNSVLARNDVKSWATSNGISVVDMAETPAQQFYNAIGEAKASNPYGAFVTQHELNEYNGMKTFTNADGSVGVAVKDDGDIVSVFKNTAKSKDKGAVTSILFKALENGGKKLDNFNSPGLSAFYLQHGFVPVARIAFNDEYAPDDWNYERDGRPNILFWVHNGDSVDTIMEKMGTYQMPNVENLPFFDGEDAYEKAAAYRDRLVNENTGWASQQAAAPQTEAEQSTSIRRDVNPNDPWTSKQAIAETQTARTFSEADEAQVQDAVKKMNYKGKVTFVDDPSAAWEGRIALETGDIEINKAKLTSRDAQRLAENPALWVLEHELFHYMWNRGGDNADELRTTVRKIYEKHPGIARGNVETNYARFLDNIIARRNEQGLDISTRAQAEEEVVGDFFRNYAFRSDEAIKMLCETNGNLGERILGWLRYKINDMKLRRSKDSWARDILKVERQYALALREAGRNPYNATRAQEDNSVKYSVKRTTDNKPFIEIEDDILAGVPKDKWKSTVFNYMRNRFTGGFEANGQHIDVTRSGAKEVVRSKSSQWLEKNNDVAYADKLRASAYIDEITAASPDYVNESPNHDRNDNITSFGRGNIRFRSGANDYIAEVLIGNRDDGSLVFYDVVNVTPTSFAEKQTKQSPKLGGVSTATNSLRTASKDTISSSDESVNTTERNSAAGNQTDDILAGLDQVAIDEAFIEDVEETLLDPSRYDEDVDYEAEINRMLGIAPSVESESVMYDKTVDATGNKLSENQVEYFQGSKVRNRDGQLRPVYHYTNEAFTEFKKMPASKGSNRTLGDGYYVSVSPNEYKHFGNNRLEMYANITNPYENQAEEPLTRDQANFIYDKYEAKFHPNDDGMYKDNVVGKLMSGRFDYVKDIAERNGIGTSDILKELGFDGIHDGPDWVAFDANQLKFVDNKTPTERNDMRFSGALDVDQILNDMVADTADDEYMQYANNLRYLSKKDADELRTIVDDAARNRGYTIKAYHGTTENFNEFKRGTQGQNHDGYLEFGGGFYFTPDAGEAREWVSRGRSGQDGRTTPNVMSVYLNPGRILNADEAVPGGADFLTMLGLSHADANFLANRTYRFINYLTEERGFSNTEVQDTLKALGFDAIDATYGNGKSGQYVVFDPEQIKSADLVTYDDNGEVIPLSQRFNENSRDIRYSSGNDVDNVLNDLINEYGAQPQGRSPRASDVRVPNQVNDNSRVSRLGRSLFESDKMTDDMRQTAKQRMVDEDWLSYIPTSNAESMAEARAYIAARQPLAAQQDFHDMVMNGKFGRKTNAIGLQLLADASARGDVDSFYEIATDLQIAATEAGQSAQIFNVLKELKGVGSAYYMQRVVDRLNTKYDDLIQKGKMQRITVSPVLMEQLTKATTVDQIAEAEEAVAKEIGRQLPLTWDDRLSNWRYFSMLANPTTHIRNMTGNLLMKGLNTAKDVTAIGVQRAAEKLGLASEGDRAHAWLTGADKSTWGDWAQQSYDEQAKNLSGGGKLGFETFVKQNMRSFDTKWLNALAQFNFKALEGEDIAFIRPAYKTALMQYMKAQGYTLNSEGKAGKVDANGVFHEMSNSDMASAVEWASNQAWKQTFRDASSLATMLNKLSKENKVSRLLVEGVMPFKKTPINIAKRGLEYSPAGIIMGISQLTNGVKKGKVTTAQAIDNLASGITGSALMALGVMLAKMGVIRAGGEKDKKYETFLEDTGDQTYAMKFGDRSINMSSIAPATIPLFMGVALNEMIEQGGDSLDLSTITDTIAGTLNPFMEMSFMSSLNSALKNYNTNGIGGALGSTLMTAAQNYGSQYLPTLGGKVAQFIDPTRRTTKSDATSPIGGNLDYYVRSLAKKVPGAEATLQPDVDVWGRTDTKDSFAEWGRDFMNKFILPTNIKVTNRDAVDNELIRVVESTGVTDFLPSDGNKYFTVKEEKYTMNAKQYAQYSQERGQAAYAAIKDVMLSQSYVTASDEEKAEMLKKALNAAYKAVNTIWKEKLGALD